MTPYRGKIKNKKKQRIRLSLSYYHTKLVDSHLESGLHQRLASCRCTSSDYFLFLFIYLFIIKSVQLCLSPLHKTTMMIQAKTTWISNVQHDASMFGWRSCKTVSSIYISNLFKKLLDSFLLLYYFLSTCLDGVAEGGYIQPELQKTLNK